MKPNTYRWRKSVRRRICGRTTQRTTCVSSNWSIHISEFQIHAGTSFVHSSVVTRCWCSMTTSCLTGLGLVCLKTSTARWRAVLVLSLHPQAEQLPCFEVPQPAQADSFLERPNAAENPADPGSLVSPTELYIGFQEQQLNRSQNEAEVVVKHEREEELGENAAPLDSEHKFVTGQEEGQLWPSDLGTDAVDTSFSHVGQQFEPLPSTFPPQSGLHVEDMAPQSHSAGKSHSVMVSAALLKRRARAFGCKRPPPDEGQGALCQVDSMAGQSRPQNAKNPSEGPTPANAAGASFFAQGRSSFSLVRRMRTPWRSSLGEKRFGCTYCDKSFMRFSQLKEHLRSHTGEKPFSCLQCGRSFTKQCNLIRHAVVHSGEKPHECSLCGKCFTQRSSLKSHQKTAHWIHRALFYVDGMPGIKLSKKLCLCFNWRWKIQDGIVELVLYILMLKTFDFSNNWCNNHLMKSGMTKAKLAYRAILLNFIFIFPATVDSHCFSVKNTLWTRVLQFSRGNAAFSLSYLTLI